MKIKDCHYLFLNNRYWLSLPVTVKVRCASEMPPVWRSGLEVKWEKISCDAEPTGYQHWHKTQAEMHSSDPIVWMNIAGALTALYGGGPSLNVATSQDQEIQDQIVVLNAACCMYCGKCVSAIFWINQKQIIGPIIIDLDSKILLKYNIVKYKIWQHDH